MDPADGDGLTRQGLEELYVRLEKPVYNVVYRWLWNAEDARDVVQEAFLKLWHMRAKVRVATVEPLLYRIAVNLARNRRRSRRLRRWVTLGAAAGARDPAPEADGCLEAVQNRTRVRRAVDALPEKLREVVVLSELSGMRYADVARTLGIPEGTVASRRHAAVKRLRTMLRPEPEG